MSIRKRLVDAKPNTPHALTTGSTAPRTASPSLESAIGAMVRTHRKRLDLTIADLATSSGLVVGTLSKIENGHISPSLSTLQRLSAALGVPLAAFFVDYDMQRDCSFVKAGAGVAIDRRGTKAGHRYELLGHSLSGDVVVEPYLITLARDAVPYTAFQHKGVEMIHMLTGTVSYRHGDQVYPMAPGDTLFFDASAPHGPDELTGLPATYLSIISYRRV